MAHGFRILGIQLDITAETPSPFINASGVFSTISSFAVMGDTGSSPDSGMLTLPFSQYLPPVGNFKNIAGCRK